MLSDKNNQYGAELNHKDSTPPEVLTRQEVAVRLGITPGAVRLIELQALAKLQKLAARRGIQLDDLITETIPPHSNLINDNEIHPPPG